MMCASPPRLAPVEAQHLPELAQLAASAQFGAWSLRALQDSLQHHHMWQLRTDSHQSIGFVVFQHLPDDSELLEIVVTPSWQKQGYGRQLLQCCIDSAQQHGSQRVLLEVRASNSAAQRLYFTAGFQLIGRRKHYYPSFSHDHMREDALILALNLVTA